MQVGLGWQSRGGYEGAAVGRGSLWEHQGSSKTLSITQTGWSHHTISHQDWDRQGNYCPQFCQLRLRSAASFLQDSLPVLRVRRSPTRATSGPHLPLLQVKFRAPSTHRGDVWLLFHCHVLWGCTGCHTIQTPIFYTWLLFVISTGLFLAGQGVLVTARGVLIQRGRACRHGNLCATHCTLKRGKGGPVVSSTPHWVGPSHSIPHAHTESLSYPTSKRTAMPFSLALHSPFPTTLLPAPTQPLSFPTTPAAYRSCQQ